MANYNVNEHKQVKDWMRTLHRIEPYSTARALWLAVVTTVALTVVMQLGAFSPEDHKLEPNFHLVYLALVNMGAFTVLYTFNFWVIRLGLPNMKSRTLRALGSTAIAAAVALISYALENLIYGASGYNLIITMIYYITSALICYMLALLLSNVTQHQQTVVENEHLQAENLLIRYETLERQIGPHFLFNSLNTLDGLIGSDDTSAHHYLQQLAAMFRYTLQKEKVVTLKEELEFSNAYLYMMTIRYGDNLKVTESIAADLLAAKTLPISLQLLIENAIKHNVISSRHPLTITIATTLHGTLRVSNPIQPKTDTETSTGIGLVNLTQRYSLIFHKELNITQTEKEFVVEMPLITD